MHRSAVLSLDNNTMDDCPRRHDNTGTDCDDKGMSWDAQKLATALEAAQSAVHEIRVSGEVALNEFAAQCQDFVLVLISFCADGAMGLNLRHLAMLLLNQHVNRSWRSFGSELQLSLATFSFRWSTHEPNLESHLRRSAMVLTSKIYGMSSQEEMEQMASSLHNLLQSGDANVQLASMRTLCEITKEVEYFRQTFLLRWCYSMLQSLIQHYMKSIRETDDNVRRLTYYATKVLRVCIYTLGEANVSCGFEEDEASFIITEFIPHWASVNCECLAAHVNQPECILRNLPMFIDLCCSLTYVLDYFAEDSGLDLRSVCALSLSLLRTIEYQYHQSNVDDYTGYSSDGDRIDLEILVLHLFELLNAGMSNSQYDDIGHGDGSWVVDENDRETVDSMVRLMTSFMIQGHGQRELWVERPNDYIVVEYADLQERDYLRNVCADALREICCGSKGIVYASIMSAVLAEFTAKQPLLQRYLSSDGDPQSGSDSSVTQAATVMETYLWILGVVGKGYVTALQKSRKVVSKQAGSASNQSAKTSKYAAITTAVPPQEVTSLVSSIASFVLGFPAPISRQQNGSVNDVSLAILQYRVLWLCGEIMYLFQGTHITCSIAKKCEELLSPMHHLSLRLQACATLARILKYPKSYFEVLEGSQQVGAGVYPLELNVDRLVEYIAEMVIQCNENSLHVPFEAITLLVKSHGSKFDESAITCVTQVSVQVMSHFCNDSILVDFGFEVLIRLLKTCSCDALCRVMGACYLPFARNTIFDADHLARVPPPCVESCISLLSHIAAQMTQRCIGDTSVQLTREVLGILTASLSVTGLMQKYVGCVMRAVSGVLECMPNEPMDHISAFQDISLSSFVNTMLVSVSKTTNLLLSPSEPGADEGAFPPAIGLFCHLVLRAGHIVPIDTLGTVLMLGFQVARQENASVRCRHTFVMAVVNLLARDADQTLRLLDHCFERDQNDLRSFFFAAWKQMHENMDSRYNSFVSCVALIEVLGALRAATGISSMKVQLLEMLFNKLPAMLASDREYNGGRGIMSQSERLGAKKADGAAFDSDDGCSDLYGSYEDEEYESSLGADDFDSDTSDSELEESKHNERESPFAPAEMYLSDMISGTGGGCGDDDSYTAALANAVPEDLLYRLKEKSDPLLNLSRGVDTQIQTAAQVQRRVVSLLTLLRQEQTDFSSLMNQLSNHHKSQIQQLFVL